MTAAAGALHFLVGGLALGPFLLWPRTRAGALDLLTGGVRRLAALERARRSVFFGDVFPEHYRAADRKVLRYLAVRSYAGLLCALVLGLLVFGAVLAGILGYGVLRGTIGWDELLTQVLLGGVLLFLDVQGLYALAALDARTARECFGPSERELLRRRIEELAASRAAVVEAVDAERRRIERDLHDGAQARLAALAMDLGLAKEKLAEDPRAAAVLVDEAHGEVKLALQELRDLARGIHPAVLTDRGLDAALSAVASRCAVPVSVDVDLPARPVPAIEGIAYFTVSELLRNVTAHARARRAWVDVWRSENRLMLQVRDDGVGGAVAVEGRSLSSLSARVGAVDGVLAVDSPAGGPTTVTVELPWRA